MKHYYFNLFASVFACAVGVLTTIFVLYGIAEGADIQMLLEAMTEAYPAAFALGIAFSATVTVIYWLSES